MSGLNPAAVEHADRCQGVPILTEDSLGQWSAECNGRIVEAGMKWCDWGVSGCESRAEASATFYGHNPRGDA